MTTKRESATNSDLEISKHNMKNVKPVKIHFIPPSGREYKDTINMTFGQYEKFVNDLLKLKRSDTS